MLEAAPRRGRRRAGQRDRMVGHQRLVEPLEQHLAAELDQEVRLAVVDRDGAERAGALEQAPGDDVAVAVDRDRREPAVGAHDQQPAAAPVEAHGRRARPAGGATAARCRRPGRPARSRRRGTRAARGPRRRRTGPPRRPRPGRAGAPGQEPMRVCSSTATVSGVIGAPRTTHSPLVVNTCSRRPGSRPRMACCSSPARRKQIASSSRPVPGSKLNGWPVLENHSRSGRSREPPITRRS